MFLSKCLVSGLPNIKNYLLKQLDKFLSITEFNNPVIDYRDLIGEFASASAAAAVLALNLLKQNTIPAALCNNKICKIDNKGILIMGFGNYITAVEVLP